jgi:hypothetical protein
VAQLQHVQHGHRLGLRPGADDAGEHRDRVDGGQQVHRQRLCAVQVGQPPPAGDQDQAAGGTGQQRPYMVGADGVVQNGQHLASGQFRPP